VRTADPVKIQRIIDAAAKLFAERHYHEVRMDDIAAKASVAKGTIYLHFKDKDDLYQALTLDSLRKLSERIRDCLVGLHDPATKLLYFNREAIRYFEHHVFKMDLIQRVERLQDQGIAGQDEVFEVSEAFRSILKSILEEFPEAAHASDDEISLAVLAFFGMLKEVLHKLPGPWSAELPERLTRIFLQGFIRSSTTETHLGGVKGV
jgi:AcrR family transcriptional regulator